MENFSIPCASVRPNKIILFDYWQGDRKKIPKQPHSNIQKDFISAKSSKRLESAIYLLCEAAVSRQVWSQSLQINFSFKVNFITLTLPSKQIHADSHIYNSIFKPFIRWWRDKNKSLLYIWKAEKQDNGNIHFHVTSNSFIHWRTLRDKWNSLCDTLGYTKRAKTTEPNSTDVHSVRNVQQLPKYLASYMTKKDLYKKPLKKWHKLHRVALKALTTDSFKLPKNYFKNIKEKVTCKHWDASKLLLNSKLTVITGTPDFQHEINLMDWNYVETVQTDYCKIYLPKRQQWSHLQVFKSKWEEFIKEVRQKCKETVIIDAPIVALPF